MLHSGYMALAKSVTSPVKSISFTSTTKLHEHTQKFLLIFQENYMSIFSTNLQFHNINEKLGWPRQNKIVNDTQRHTALCQYNMTNSRCIFYSVIVELLLNKYLILSYQTKLMIH